MIHLDDLKTEGGERYFIVGCFDNSGYNGFVNHGRIEKTTADENSNHCAGLFDGSTGSGNDGTGSGTTEDFTTTDDGFTTELPHKK